MLLNLEITIISGGFNAFNSGVFTLIGKYFILDSNMRGICLVSSMHTPMACGSTVSSTSTDSLVRQELNSRQSKNLNLVKSLRVRIIKTSGSSVPALASVQAWGYLAYSCPAPLARSILSKWRTSNIIQQRPVCDSAAAAAAVDAAAHLHRVGKEEEGNKEAHENAAAPSYSSLADDDFQIPQEFLDALTFEIMALPVRLPSGNVIDERTLERFTQQEAIWGRSPSDPFTGQLITDTRRPLYDTSLKQRIDSFLLNESHRPCLRNVPRTVGPIRQHRQMWQIPERPVPPTPQPHVLVHQPSPPATSNASANANTSQSGCDPSRRWLSALAGTMAVASTTANKRSGLSSRNNNNLTIAAAAAAVVALPLCPCGANGITVFTNDRPPPGGLGGVIYSLPCSHRVCRSCLLNCKNRNDLSCPHCKSAFTLDQPVLCHKN